MNNITKSPAPTTGTPTISRIAVDTIIELVYDAAKRTTGLVVSRFGGLWNIEQATRVNTGEVLVPYSPKNNLIATGCVLLPSIPEHHGDKAELVAEIEAFLHRYVDLSPLFEKIASHYILLSWAYDAFNELPYLRLRGDYGTGKTRGLLAIGSLAYKPFFASGASTVSPIFHTLDTFGGTLVLDETDFRFSDPTNELVKVFNNGTVRGLPVLRTIQNRDKEFNPRAFRVFGPKIVAMRGSFSDPALESRFLTEEMGQRQLRKDIPISLPAQFFEEAQALRNKLLHFRLCEYFNTKLDTEATMAELEPRVNQIALPLLSLVDDQALRADIAAYLATAQANRRSERAETFEARVVACVHDAFQEPKGRAVSIGDVTNLLNSRHLAEYGQPVSSRRVGHVIRTRLHLSTHKSNGIYIIPESEKPKVEALAARYTV